VQISPRTKTELVQDSQMWMGNGGRPRSPARSIALDLTAFDITPSTGDFPDGFIPSGVALARNATTGLYIPYGGAPSEVQTVDLGAASAGTVTIGFDGETTGAIAFNATSSTVQTAINGLSNVQPGDITVTGGPWPADMVFTFGGQYLGENVGAVVVTPSGLTDGTVTVETTAAGGGSASTNDGRGLLFAAIPYDRQGVGPLGAALFWDGVVISAHLPTGHGVDAAFKALDACRDLVFL